MGTKQKHGHCSGKRYTSTYLIWVNFRQLCFNKNSIRYHLFGAKGITVCNEWKNSFSNFIRDMGERPAGLYLNRIDNTGDFCKENCEWSKRSPRERIRIKGELLYNYCKRNNITREAVRLRIMNGWTEDEIIDNFRNVNKINHISNTEHNDIQAKIYLMGKFTENPESIKQFLDILTKRERIIIENRLGFLDSKRMTLAKIGQMFGITRERVRQLEHHALCKITEEKNRLLT